MTERPSITLLSPNLGGNLMIRAYELIELLRGDFRIQIVGRGRPGELWPPLARVLDVERRSFDVGLPELAIRSSALCRELIDGDLVLALGLRPESYGLGLVARRILRRPLVLDNHEWEAGFLPPLRRILLRPSPALISALFYRTLCRLLDPGASRADAMFVTNTFLQRRYGGYWLPHVRDEQIFQARPDRSQERSEGLTVMFLGTAHPHKGLSDLLRAWAAVEAPSMRLRIVGTLSGDDHEDLARQADHRVSFEGPIALDQVPSTLAAADLVVIPQRQGRETVGQLPSKMVEAMAMGRAIIATAVGDAPIWLAEGAGVIVPPGEPAELARAISSLAASPDRRAELGHRARERFLRLGSVAAHRDRVVDLLRGLIEGRSVPRAWPSITDLAGAPA